MFAGVTTRAVLWLTAAAVLMTEAARPSNLTCPAGCSCTVANTLSCDHSYTGTSFPTVDGDDLVNFFFSDCRFAVDLSTVPYKNAELLSLKNCVVAPSIDAGSLTGFTRLRTLVISSSHHLNSVHAEAFANLSSLESLDLTANNLSALPTRLFAGLSMLKSVDLSGNRWLGSLPADLFGSAKSGVTGFVCNDCGLNAVRTELLAQMPQLTRLEFNGNNLTTLNGGRMFASLRYLEELSLDSNRLKMLDADEFSGLEPSLKMLRLGHNRITTIDSTTISRLKKLRHLELDDNLLTGIASAALPQSLFSDGSPPAVLMLGGNPWNCDCSLLWLRKANITHNAETIICVMPASVKSRRLYDISEDSFCPKEHSSKFAVAAIVCSSLGLAALGFVVVYRYCAKRRLRASPARYASGGYYSPADDKA